MVAASGPSPLNPGNQPPIDPQIAGEGGPSSAATERTTHIGPFERLTPPGVNGGVNRPLGRSAGDVQDRGASVNRTSLNGTAPSGSTANSTSNTRKNPKPPQWVQRYREEAPLEPIQRDGEMPIERHYDPVLQALLRAHPTWEPNNDQRDFVLHTRSAADRLLPVSQLRRLIEDKLGMKAHGDRVLVAENFGLALSNLLLHRYPSSNDVIALHPDPVTRRPSEEPESDRLASLWLVESLIYLSANRPEVLRELTARVDSIRNFEMECECHYGIDERLRGVHFGAEVNSTLVMATVATYCRSARNPEARALVENLFCLLTGVVAPTARRALEGAEQEVQRYQAEHGPLRYWQPL